MDTRITIELLHKQYMFESFLGALWYASVRDNDLGWSGFHDRNKYAKIYLISR